MNPRRYEVVGYDPALKPALAQLLTLLWSPSRERNAAIFAWKYEGNPYLSRPHLYVALWDGKVIGMRGVYGGRWEAGARGSAPRAMCAGDLVIAPEHRNRGVFTRIMEYALDDLEREGVSYLFNFSAGAATRLGSLASGWESVGPLQRMKRYLRHRVVRWLRSRWSRRPDCVAAASPRPHPMADLIRRLEYDGRIRHLRDETFFEWRFRKPASSYRFFFLGGDRLEGYLVLQPWVHPADGLSYRIVDWEGETPAIRSALLAAALERHAPGPVEVWTESLERASHRALAQAGFIEVQPRSMADYYPTILVRPVAPPRPSRPWLYGGRDVLELANWDVRLLDSDGT